MQKDPAECYALGLDPTEATNDFRIVSIELVGGKPKVEWERGHPAMDGTPSKPPRWRLPIRGQLVAPSAR